MDQTGLSRIELGNVSRAGAVKISSVDGTSMWIREKVAMDKKVSTHRVYVAKFIVVALQLIEMISYEEPRKLRKILYILGTKLLKHEAIKAIIRDWAITLNVHPWSLGVTTEEKGHVTIPPGLTMTCAIIDNVFKPTVVEKRGLRGSEVLIPSRIQGISVKASSGPKLRAIAVFEHQNLNFEAAAVKEHMADVLLVQTGGYPSFSVREFLNLLCSHAHLQSTPFLFMSDHDVYGFDVYNVLKYGCKATAWASPTMVCPRLQWAGPTIADLEGQVEVYAPMHREMLRKADTTVTEHRAVAMEQEWKASTLTKLRNKMKSKPLAEDARTRYNNILKSGILDIRCEREFGEELQAMVENEQQFSFLDFAMVQPQGPEIFAAGRIQQLAPRDNAAAVTVPQPAISQKTRDYQAASRESSTEVTSQQVAKAREMVMDEYS